MDYSQQLTASQTLSHSVKPSWSKTVSQPRSLKRLLTGCWPRCSNDTSANQHLIRLHFYTASLSYSSLRLHYHLTRKGKREQLCRPKPPPASLTCHQRYEFRSLAWPQTYRATFSRMACSIQGGRSRGYRQLHYFCFGSEVRRHRLFLWTSGQPNHFQRSLLAQEELNADL